MHTKVPIEETVDDWRSPKIIHTKVPVGGTNVSGSVLPTHSKLLKHEIPQTNSKPETNLKPATYSKPATNSKPNLHTIPNKRKPFTHVNRIKEGKPP